MIALKTRLKSCIVAIVTLITSILFSGFVLLNIVLDHLLFILDSRLKDEFRLFAFTEEVVELDSLLPGLLEQCSVLSVLETSGELLKLCLLLREIVACPSVGLIVALHGDELTKRGLLEDEVGYGLEGLLLAHDEADLLGLLVAEELTVPGATLLPLLISEAVELASDLEDALLFLLSSGLLLNLGKRRLYQIV